VKTLKIPSNVPTEKKKCSKKNSKKSFKCALKKVSKKSLMGALRESVVNKLQRNPSSVPKQITKVPQKKRVQILFHPLFCKSSPQFRHFTPSYGEFTEI
jgi:hypothetical protein